MWNGILNMDMGNKLIMLTAGVTPTIHTLVHAAGVRTTIHNVTAIQMRLPIPMTVQRLKDPAQLVWTKGRSDDCCHTDYYHKDYYHSVKVTVGTLV